MIVVGCTFIGVNSPSRLTCGDNHLPGVYAPSLDQTFCICGRERWAGRVGSWKSVERRNYASRTTQGGVGIGAPGLLDAPSELIGWDTYFMHAPGCQNVEADHCEPHCHLQPGKGGE